MSVGTPKAILLALVAVAVAVLVGWLLAATAADPAVAPNGQLPGAALSVEEREALAGPPVHPGQHAAAPDPAVNFTDPAVVARTYVVAAHSRHSADAGQTNRRAVPYAVPGGPDGQVGVLVLDAPPPGHIAAVTVTELEVLESAAAGDRVGYRAEYRVAVGVPGQLGPAGPAQSRYLVLAHQPDGRWLVAVDSADPPDGDAH